MNRNYIEEFRERYYPQDRKEFLDATSRYLQDHIKEIIPEFIRDLEHVFSSLFEFQQQMPNAIGWIQISLLESSVYLGKPIFRVEVFDENGLFGRVLYDAKIRADWLFTQWQTFQENLANHCRRMHAERYIHSEQIRVLMFETIEYLACMAALYLKYVIFYCDRMKGFKKLLYAETFTVSFGQYHDWQKILYRQDQEVDIFFNPHKKTLVFQKYSDKVYRDKEFKDLDLSHVRFYKCKFIRCRFEQSILNDAVFEECFFHDVVVVDTEMYGISFTGCNLEKVDFTGAKFWCQEQKIDEFYQQPEFISCESSQQLPNLEVK